MAQQLIGEILSERRKQLGLSVERVVNATKLQRRVIEAFEKSDFAAMPPKGYAKANLASYARYLGLDTTEIIRVYEEQLYHYERMLAQERSPRRRSAERDRRSGNDYGGSHNYEAGQDYREDRDDRAEGSYRGRGPARPTPSAPTTRPASARGYADQASEYDRTYQASRRPGLYDTPSRRSGSSSSSERTRSDEASRDERAARAGHRDSRAERPDYRGGRSGYSDESERRGVSTARDRDERRDGRAQGRDARREYETTRADRQQREATSRDRRNPKPADRELRVADAIDLNNGYEGGSGGWGGSYGFTQAGDRRSLSRSSGPAEREQVSFGQSLKTALVGLRAFFGENRMAAVIVFGVIALLLVVIVVFAVSSCTRGDTNQQSTIPVVQMGSGSSDSASANSSASDQTTQPENTTDGTNAAPVITTEPTAEVETPQIDLTTLPPGSNLVFSVDPESLETPWIEVSVDGAPIYANQAVAGESQTFFFDSQITISLSSPEVVTLEVNGIQVEPTIDATGLATLTATCIAE